MTKTLRGFWCNPKLMELETILDMWCDMHERYVDCHQAKYQDAAYLYSERTSLGVLAGAAWKCDWVALEEYPTKKRTHTEKEKSTKDNHRSGRCDLYIGTQDDRTQFALEAKQAWQEIGPNSKNSLSELRKKLKEACADAEQLDETEAPARLALTFCAPYINHHDESIGDESMNSIKLISDAIEDWIRKLKDIYSKGEISGFAYCFPKNGRSYVAMKMQKSATLEQPSLSSSCRHETFRPRIDCEPPRPFGRLYL